MNQVKFIALINAFTQIKKIFYNRSTNSADFEHYLFKFKNDFLR